MGKRKSGHYCKECGRYRANERFSGKGHRQHVCKDCKRGRRFRKDNSRTNDNLDEERNEAIKSDENLTYLVNYIEERTSLWLPQNEWEEMGNSFSIIQDYEDQEEIVVTISKDVGDMLRKGNQEQSIEKAILNSIALSLYLSKEITLERAAYLANSNFTDFIHYLQNNKIEWSVGPKDGHAEYQKSMGNLLMKTEMLN